MKSRTKVELNVEEVAVVAEEPKRIKLTDVEITDSIYVNFLQSSRKNAPLS